MSNNPLISVVMPTRNSEAYLRTALESILAQTYAPLEIIIADGNSTDQTAAIAQAYPNALFMQQEGIGIGGGFNTGVRHSKGDFVAFLSSDDYWTPDKLEKQMAFLDANPQLKMVIGHAKFFLQTGFEIPKGFKAQLFEGDQVAMIPEALLARRRVFDQIGLFDERYKLAVDVDWFARVKDLGLEIGVLPDRVLYKRIHGSNAASDALTNNRELLDIMRRSVQRQRTEKVVD